MKAVPIDTSETFTIDAYAAAALAEQQSALVPYIPKSKAPFRLNTLIPRNIDFEVQKALNRVVRLNGNIDNYVRNHLKYDTVDELWQGLAAEQVDAVGMYLSQFKREQGIIIGDQTGVGKGRQAAAVIRHALKNGYLPVFITKKAELFTDMYRDLKAIGFNDIKPFILNTTNNARIKEADGTVVFSPLSKDDQYNLLVTKITVPIESPESIAWHRLHDLPLPDMEDTPTLTIENTIDYLPEAYNSIFCTYSQIQSAAPYKSHWLSRMVNAGVEDSTKFKRIVFVLDESHSAGGYNTIIGKWMREVLPQSKACCFLSATFAKYPEVMPFYAQKTAIQETGLSDANFVYSMRKGGLALQEIVASNLAESGQLIRRQRPNTGAITEYLTLDGEPANSETVKKVEQITQLMNSIIEFEQSYIVPIIDELHAEAMASAEILQKKPRQLGVTQTSYFSKVFNVIDQMLFTLKVEAITEQTIARLKQDKKVVIAFKSTMGSFLKDLALTSGDEVIPEQLDFARVLIKGLNAVFMYNYKDINDEKSKRRILLKTLPQSGIDTYNDLLKTIKSSTTGLTISPIDQLIYKLENAVKAKQLGGHQSEHFKVKEVTGRNQRIAFHADGSGVVQSYRADIEQAFREFNSGEVDVLLINESGSTGFSAHASQDFKDQRTRVMILHQLGLDVYVEIQKRGRIGRTGEVVPPEYLYVVLNLPSEVRKMAMLKAKLKALDANTTGSQKTNDDILDSIDFFNKYGDSAAWEWIDENPYLAERMGNPTYVTVTENGYTELRRYKSNVGAIRQLTGRMALLTVAEQQQVFDELLTKYNYQVAWAKQLGTYDLEIEFLKLDAEVQQRFLYSKGMGGQTPFGKDTVRDETMINNLRRPFSKEELDEKLLAALEGRKPEDIKQLALFDLKENYPSIVEDLTAVKRQSIIKNKADLAALPTLESLTTEKEKAKLTRDTEKLNEALTKKQTALEDYLQELQSIEQHLKKGMGTWRIGDIVKVPIIGSLISSWGVFLGISIKSAQNRFSLSNVSLIFAIADSRKIMEFNFTYDQRLQINNIYAESETISEDDKSYVLNDWNAIVKKTASRKREKRHILTENIVAASFVISTTNKLIKYNTKDGSIKNGILLHPEFGTETEERKAILPISDALETIKKLSGKAFFTDDKLTVRFESISPTAFQVYVSKRGNQNIYTDHILRALLMKAQGADPDELPDFVQNASEMTSGLHMDKLDRFLKRLDHYELKYLGTEKVLEAWEIENDNEWEKQQQPLGRFSYQLKRPYGEGTHPTSGFIDYQEPTTSHPYGAVEYSRKLTDNEKFNYSLVPIFKNVETPYYEWKAYIEKSPLLREDFNEVLAQLKDESASEAMLTLGYFISNNPHESGNAEFVFGTYNEKDLGQAAYEDYFGAPTAIQLLIAQLKIELQLAA